jgi:FlaA1/EpsC-like NDP-sugar epimerase
MKVLVTGGSGTLGRFTCRELIRRGYEPISFVRNIGRQIVYGNGIDFIIGNVEDYCEVERAIKKTKAMGVVHLAANKHILACENQPINAIETNIIGTLNVLNAIAATNTVSRAIFMSTDKAAQPSSVYGMTKYLGERVVKERSCGDVKMNSIRLGNIFGSVGSVIPLWKKLIDEGENIVLRTNGFSNPRRFGITPSEAGSFVASIFNVTDAFQNGSILFPELDLIDIGTLAEVMVDGTDSVVDEVSIGTVEHSQEWMFNEKEYKYIQHKFGIYEIKDYLSGEDDTPDHLGLYGCGANPRRLEPLPGPIHKNHVYGTLDFKQTKKFYNRVLRDIIYD